MPREKNIGYPDKAQYLTEGAKYLTRRREADNASGCGQWDRAQNRRDEGVGQTQPNDRGDLM